MLIENGKRKHADNLERLKLLRDKFETAVARAKKGFNIEKVKNCLGKTRKSYQLPNELNGKEKSTTTMAY